jgi:hypothetical protein
MANGDNYGKMGEKREIEVYWRQTKNKEKMISGDVSLLQKVCLRCSVNVTELDLAACNMLNWLTACP